MVDEERVYRELTHASEIAVAETLSPAPSPLPISTTTRARRRASN